MDTYRRAGQHGSQIPAATYIDAIGHNFWDRAGWGVQPDVEVTKNWYKTQITMGKCMVVIPKEQAKHRFKKWSFLTNYGAEYGCAANCGGHTDTETDLTSCGKMMPERERHSSLNSNVYV